MELAHPPLHNSLTWHMRCTGLFPLKTVSSYFCVSSNISLCQPILILNEFFFILLNLKIDMTRVWSLSQLSHGEGTNKHHLHLSKTLQKQEQTIFVSILISSGHWHTLHEQRGVNHFISHYMMFMSVQVFISRGNCKSLKIKGNWTFCFKSVKPFHLSHRWFLKLTGEDHKKTCSSQSSDYHDVSGHLKWE